jgi:hypothetical protein
MNKPWYKKWWIWLITFALSILVAIGSNSVISKKQIITVPKTKDNTNKNEYNSKQNKQPLQETVQQPSRETPDVGNLFFFNGNIQHVNYKGVFLFNNIIEKDIKLNINEVADLKYGKLIELKLDNIEGVPSERLSLGYFYVQKDKIYKITPTQEKLKKLKEREEIPNNSFIVCQNQEMKDTLKEDERGWHQYIKVNENRIEYHSYNNQVETGYFERFTWEKNKGLIFYQSGYGAERDSIELQLSYNGYKENNESFYGEWQLKKDKASGPVGTYSSDDVKALAGKHLTFSKDSATCFGDKVEIMNNTVTNPVYKKRVITKNDFQSDYRVTFEQLGINENSVTEIEATDTRGICTVFFITPDNYKLILLGGGTFFELDKFSNQNNSTSPDE